MSSNICQYRIKAWCPDSECCNKHFDLQSREGKEVLIKGKKRINIDATEQTATRNSVVVNPFFSLESDSCDTKQEPALKHFSFSKPASTGDIEPSTENTILLSSSSSENNEKLQDITENDIGEKDQTDETIKDLTYMEMDMMDKPNTISNRTTIEIVPSENILSEFRFVKSSEAGTGGPESTQNTDSTNT